MFNALSDFVIFCRIERRLSELTCRAYERDVRACLTFLRDQEGVYALGDVRTPELRRFLADEAQRRPAPSSQARTVAALRCFFRFCVESEHLERDPAYVLRTPKKREGLPDILDRRELTRLLLALFAYGGLRRSGTCSPPSCSGPARTCARFRSCLGTSIWIPRSGIRALRHTSLRGAVKRLPWAATEAP